MPSSSSVRTAVALAAWSIGTFVFALACGSAQQLGEDGGKAGDDAGSSTCETDCEQRIASCADAGVPAGACSKFCELTPPDDQARCLGSTSCPGLALVLELGGCCNPSDSFSSGGTCPDNDAAACAYDQCVSACTVTNQVCSAPFCGGPFFRDGGVDAGCASLCEKNPGAGENCFSNARCTALAAEFESKGSVCGL